MTISVIEPHGFCAGVTAALKKALSLAATRRNDSGTSLCCLHELVHNEIVVEELKKRGFVFVENLAEVPDGATVLFSAHGVAPQIREAAKARGQRFGPPPKQRPEDFGEYVRRWKNGTLSAREASRQLQIAHSTFLKWARG